MKYCVSKLWIKKKIILCFIMWQCQWRHALVRLFKMLLSLKSYLDNVHDYRLYLCMCTMPVEDRRLHRTGLKMAVNCHVGTGNWTYVLCKISKFLISDMSLQSWTVVFSMSDICHYPWLKYSILYLVGTPSMLTETD